MTSIVLGAWVLRGLYRKLYEIDQLEVLTRNVILFAAPMPIRYRVKDPKFWPKGVENRNKGVEWIVKHVEQTGDDSGVFYFADDDNTYDIRIFEEVIP